MEFKLDDEHPWWIADTTVDDTPVVIRLETEDETAADASVTGLRILNHVRENWALIQRSLVDDLLETHNEEWADPSRDRQKLSRDEFFKKLIPSTIDYGAWEDEDGQNESCSLIFDDSNMFGGHAIQVYWNPTNSPISPTATIEG